MVSIFDDMTQVCEAEVQRMLPLVNEQRRSEALRYKHLFGQFACLKSWLMLKELLKPLEKDKSLKISLGEMIEKGLIVSANSKNGTSCDTKKSFSKITRKKPW